MKIKSFFYLTAFSFLGFYSCTSSNNTDEEDEEHDDDFRIVFQEQLTLAGIKVGLVEERELRTIVPAHGRIDVPPGSLANISAPLGGFVREAVLYEGSEVRKGQILVVLEHPEYIKLQQQYLESLSRLTFLKEDYDRRTELHKEQAASSRVMQQTEAEYMSEKARMESLRAGLRVAGLDPDEILEKGIRQRVVLRSPFDGYISQATVNIGKQVGPEEVLYQVVDPSHLHVELQVFPRDAALLKKGQIVRFRMQGTEVWKKGEIILMGKSVQLATGTVRVHVHPLDEDEVLIPGVLVEAEIEAGGVRARALPHEAFTDEDGLTYLWKKERNGFRRIPVKTGRQDHRYRELLSEIQDSVVVWGAYYFAEVDEED